MAEADEASKKAKPPNAGKGRVKGVPNKNTAAIKDMILQALTKAGGVDYLVGQAALTPAAFLSLVGKVLPLQIAGEMDHNVKVSIIELVAPGFDGGGKA